MLMQSIRQTSTLKSFPVHRALSASQSKIFRCALYIFLGCGRSFITFRVSRRPREMYCGNARVCLSVCVCVSVRGRMLTLLHAPRCKLGEW